MLPGFPGHYQDLGITSLSMHDSAFNIILAWIARVQPGIHLGWWGSRYIRDIGAICPGDPVLMVSDVLRYYGPACKHQGFTPQGVHPSWL